MIWNRKAVSTTAFCPDIMRLGKVEWRSVFLLVTQRSVLHPSRRHVWPVRPSERLKPPDGTWATRYKRACCRAQAPWHDGSAQLGLAWKRKAGWNGFLSAFIIWLPTQGEKVFGSVRERAPDSMSRTQLHGTAIRVYICCSCCW